MGCSPQNNSLPSSGKGFFDQKLLQSENINVQLETCVLHIIKPNQTGPYIYGRQVSGSTISILVPMNPQEPIEFEWSTRPSFVFNSRLRNVPRQSVFLMSFQEKHAWFFEQMESRRIFAASSKMQNLIVDRSNIFASSISQINTINFQKEVKVSFNRQNSIDSGGLTREWITLCAKELLGSVGLLEVCDSPRTMHKFAEGKPMQDMLPACALLGTILGKALLEKIPIEISLCYPILRQLCGRTLNLTDVYTVDSNIYSSYVQILRQQIGITQLQLQFAAPFTLEDGTIVNIDLISSGASTIVRTKSKELFLKKKIEFDYVLKIAPLIAEVKRSLYKIINQEWLSVFLPHELEMVLCGRRQIDVKEWEANTEYEEGYTKQSQVVMWFWQTMRSSTQNQLVNVLHFVTGTDRVPLMGMRNLISNRNNIKKFSIKKTEYQKRNSHITSSTCFNRLILPDYPNQQIFKQKIFVITDTYHTYHGLS